MLTTTKSSDDDVIHTGRNSDDDVQRSAFARIGHPTLIEVVDHKPGRRCTERWTMSDGSVWYAKKHSQRSRHFPTRDFLHALTMTGVIHYKILAFGQHDEMIVTSSAEGTTLTSASPTLQFQRAGQWLAALHAMCPLQPMRSWSTTAELATLAKWAATCGDSGSPIDSTLDWLARNAAADRDRSSPIHKDFHPLHCFQSEQFIDVIDFDEVRLGPPEFDVSHFIEYLHLMCWREGDAERAESHERAFLDGYGSVGCSLDSHLLRWSAVYASVKQIWQSSICDPTWTSPGAAAFAAARAHHQIAGR